MSSLLGYTLDQHGDEVVFEAEVSASSDGTWHLLLRVTRDGETSERRIDGESCDAVAGAAAVAIALVLKPEPEAESADAEVEPSSVPAESAEPTAAPPDEVEDPKPDPPPRKPAEPRSPAEAAAPASPIGFAARIGAVVDVASLGQNAYGAELALGLLVGDHWRGEIFGRWLPEQQVSLGRGASADVGWLGGGARGCAQPLAGNVGLLACLGFEGGRISATGQGISRSQSDQVIWLGPLAAIGALWSWSEAFALVATAEIAAPLARHEFAVDGVGVVHRLPAATVRFGLGLEGASR